MAIKLTSLVSQAYPPGDMYLPEVRTGVDPRWDHPSLPKPYSGFLVDTVAQGEDMLEAANRRWAMGFPARIRAGEPPAGAGILGTRVTPLHMPERLTGVLMAVSI